MKFKKIRVGKLALMASISLFLFGFSALVHTPCSDAHVYEEASPEFEILKKKIEDLFSMPASEREKEPFYQSLLQMEEEDFDKLLELFAGDSGIYQFLLNIRELDPYLTSDDWGDWNEQVLTYTLPPGPPPGGRTQLVGWWDVARNPEPLPDVYTTTGPGATLPSIDTPVTPGPGAALPRPGTALTLGPGAALPRPPAPVTPGPGAMLPSVGIRVIE